MLKISILKARLTPLFDDLPFPLGPSLKISNFKETYRLDGKSQHQFNNMESTNVEYYAIFGVNILQGTRLYEFD